MFGSLIVYSGVIAAIGGVVLLAMPARWRAVTRTRSAMVAGAGVLLVAVGFVLPAPESRAERAETRLDKFMPVWQFHEFHTMNIAAPPARVFDAIKRVRADEILLFRTLTWIRRGGRPLPESVLNAGDREPLLDIVTRTGFVWLADDPPRELAVGTVIAAPRGTRGTLTPDVFTRQLPPGFVLATMNFVVSPAGPAGSLVSTETRVFANSPSVRRLFAAYWRVIYPGSAIIRRMWLRAIERRATTASAL